MSIEAHETYHWCVKCRGEAEPAPSTKGKRSCGRCGGETVELARGQTPVIGQPLPGKQEAA